MRCLHRMAGPLVLACALVVPVSRLARSAFVGAQEFGSHPPSAAPEGSPAETPGAGAESVEPAPAAEDPTRTAGGALAAFMRLRRYLTIRELKAVMTPELQARFEHDSTPFNGKRGARIAVFDFTEKDLRAVRPSGKSVRAATAVPAGAASDAPGPAAYLATVRSVWEDQGEAVEQRVESVRIAQREDGLWRVASLERVSSDPLRFKEAVPGVTALRLVLRAWVGRDPAATRGNLTAGFLKRYEGREGALKDLFAGANDPRHVAYQILEMKPQGAAVVVARVKLFEASPGRPSPLDGSVHALRLVRKGPPWLLDAWD